MSHNFAADQLDLQHLSRRSIIPLIRPRPPAAKHARALTSFRSVGSDDLPDLDDVQGDVVYLFPKKAENFIFFRIANVKSFRTALGSFAPSTSMETAGFIVEIALRKKEARARNAQPSLIKKSNTQIALTRMGLNFIGVRGATGDVRFDTHAMRDDKTNLGDQRDWDPAFEKTKYDPINGSVNDDTGALHGVITVAGSDPNTCTERANDVKAIFGSSITVVSTMEGRARPPPYTGHEHFGYEDGVSQPALRNLTAAKPGQVEVDPGVILMGFKGDPVLEDPKVQRPAWTRGGTMMVFRKLEQFVPEFNAYLKKNGPRWREFAPPEAKDLTDKEGADLWGARIIGRWKSGAPLALAPIRDDKALADDADRNNNFDYHVHGIPSVSPRELSDYHCPFSAHTRKLVPRNLDPYIRREYLESGMIVRGGLPYGVEVTPEEEEAGESSEDPDKKRGLMFVCYQSSLDQGFVRQTIAYGNNDYFPTTSLLPQNHGQDPIIGGPPATDSAAAPNEAMFVGTPGALPENGDQVNLLLTADNGDKIQVSGFAEVQAANAADPPGVPQEFFVTSRGGEYFFVPPISTLKKWASSSSATLDIMFILDTTSSMQKYIDQARDRIEAICDDIVASGNWDATNIRVGLIVFRDHAQNGKDYGYVTKLFAFESDIAKVKSNLASLDASGGGDGPEAQCDALTDALNSAWNDDATKVTILVTDSPPHGIDEYQDAFPDGCPEQNDPVRAISLMADNGITLHVIACEPTLSGSFSKAHDFYNGITQKTGGTMVALTDEATLSNIIVGRVLETSDIQRHAVQQRDNILKQAKAHADPASISQNLFNQLSASNAQIHQFDVESIYVSKTEADDNANVWRNATQIDSATKGKIKKVTGLRVKQEYRQGGSMYQKAQSMKLSKQPVSRSHCDNIVNACLKRK